MRNHYTWLWPHLYSGLFCLITDYCFIKGDKLKVQKRLDTCLSLVQNGLRIQIRIFETDSPRPFEPPPGGPLISALESCRRLGSLEQREDLSGYFLFVKTLVNSLKLIIFLLTNVFWDEATSYRWEFTPLSHPGAFEQTPLLRFVHVLSWTNQQGDLSLGVPDFRDLYPNFYACLRGWMLVEHTESTVGKTNGHCGKMLIQPLTDLDRGMSPWNAAPHFTWSGPSWCYSHFQVRSGPNVSRIHFGLVQDVRKKTSSSRILKHPLVLVSEASWNCLLVNWVAWPWVQPLCSTRHPSFGSRCHPVLRWLVERDLKNERGSYSIILKYSIKTEQFSGFWNLNWYRIPVGQLASKSLSGFINRSNHIWFEVLNPTSNWSKAIALLRRCTEAC